MNLEDLTFLIFNPSLFTSPSPPMLGVFEHYIPKFNTFNKQKQLDIILNGYDKDNEEFFTSNVSLQYAVQNFIIETKKV